MNDPLQDLTDVLTAQASALRGLVLLLDDQQAALRRADTAAVATTLVEQAPILRRLLQLDRQRHVLARGLATRLGIGPGPLTLSALLARAPTAPSALTSVQHELRKLLGAVDLRNRRNAFLLDRLVGYVDGLMRVIAGPGPEAAPVYAASGQRAAPRTTARLLDRSA